MTFNTALSGLRAANTDLEVTGNNIANASTMGFKHSRAEFGDVYASSLVNSVNDKTGNGVSVNAIAQQFDQGVLSLTGNSLDLAIDGSGFFILSDSSGATSFTRAGYFGLDESGFITNNTGSRLQGFLPTESGGVGGTPDDLRVQAIDLPPNATQQVDLLFNLDARSASPVNTTFNPQDADSFNSSTSLTVFDSQGQSHVLSSYFVKSSSLDNVWNMYNFIPDANGVLQNVLADGEISAVVAAATDANNQAQAALNNVTEAVTAATTAVNSFSVANAAALTAALNTARASLVTASTSAVTPASGTEYQGVIDSIDVAIALGSNSGDAANVSEAQAILVELNNVDALTATAAGSSASILADYTAIFGDGKSYFELTFGTDGTLQSTDPLQLNINNWNPDSANRSSTDGSTATVSDFIIDISRSTQFGSAFAVTKVDQNGSAAGQLNGLEINNAGEVFARYTNGEESLLGQVAMASFANEQGLIPQGESSWVQSLESGNAQVGVPLARNLGAIQSGALEESNVDLSAELVRLIVAQRNFQANAKTIETADAVAQTIINMR
ncbi:flagellar hook protein FlgE [uncultured Oceanicoccus sp.]|uniref:flagellar hook protein FlgE n=1 Tax=uncultured Oceanicoccus sp. TaxID=1706381 RepID=UPI0030DC8A8B